jgi:hypothetical protein
MGAGTRGAPALRPCHGVGECQRPDPAPRRDVRRRQATTGSGVRLPCISVRNGSPVRARQEPVGFQGQGEGEDGSLPGDSPGRIVVDLNPLPRGWFGYFKHARPRLFRGLDQFVRRLRAVPRKQDKRPSMGRSEADHRRWTDACFADQGLFTLLTAYECARDIPDEETATGELCAGNPHARFGGREGNLPTPIHGSKCPLCWGRGATPWPCFTSPDRPVPCHQNVMRTPPKPPIGAAGL